MKTVIKWKPFPKTKPKNSVAVFITDGKNLGVGNFFASVTDYSQLNEKGERGLKIPNYNRFGNGVDIKGNMRGRKTKYWASMRGIKLPNPKRK